QLLSLVKKSCHEIEDICSGIFLLGELTTRTKDRVASYGEWLSSRIISAAMESQQISNTWKDSRELIITNAAFTHAEPDFEQTNNRVISYFSSQPAGLFILPGFIAATPDGITTTLGRGGSDYTASVLAAALQAAVLE